jgi:glutamyl-tRNA reductase
MAERQSVLPEIHAMIEEEAARFDGWLRARTTAPILRELRAQADSVTESELNWALAKLPDLTERERQVVSAMASRLTGKLLHGPIQWLKAQAEAGPGVRQEPDYGMSSLAPNELTEMFYGTIDTVGENNEEYGR